MQKRWAIFEKIKTKFKLRKRLSLKHNENIIPMIYDRINVAGHQSFWVYADHCIEW